ncbi:hypothetical protein C2845_PM09G04910 [Panicum miliaceum]|uniref:RNase H type-1 domain-containing protein n=1 Tax=Panicum miliaceum TaxID=4540 RepID=A0A3L6S0M4_PANMI|nr:hypothetical protein C2845_PM09G04910 [Panicum miliaceum]
MNVEDVRVELIKCQLGKETINKIWELVKCKQLKINGKKVQSPAIHSWKPPSENFLQINTDGTYDQNTRTGGWGFVVRDSKGEVLLAGAGKFMRAAWAIQTEVVAALKAIQQAAQLGMTHIILKTDASVLAISSLLHRN